MLVYLYYNSIINNWCYSCKKNKIDFKRITLQTKIISHTRITHKQNTLIFHATRVPCPNRRHDPPQLPSSYGCGCWFLFHHPYLAVGIGIMPNATQWNGTTLNEWWNENAKLSVFHEMAKRRHKRLTIHSWRRLPQIHASVFRKSL